MRAALTEVSISTSPEAEEAVFALLEQATGQTPSVYADARRGRLTLSVHLGQARVPRQALVSQLERGLRRVQHCGLDPSPARIRIRVLPAVDWAESWKRHFPILDIARRLLIRPSWSRRRARSGQALVEIDPGLSFGTGHHPTTRFCLEELVRAESLPRPRSLLDAGTGSGLLAIAGVKLGYHPVDAFDFDPAAVRVSRANVRRNRVSGRIRVFELDLQCPNRRLPARDVVCANLQADLLLAESDRLAGWVRPGGRLVLAGILRTEIAAVVATFEGRGFRCLRKKSGGEWTSASFASRLE